MSDRRSAALGSLLALAAASLFAMLGPLSRFAADAGLEGMAFAAWRAGAGAVALGVALAITGRIASGRAQLRALDSRGRAALATAAVMGLVVNVTVFIAFGRITIALALMLFYAYPALVAATEVLLGRDRLTAPKLVALGLASAGVAAVLAGALVVSGDDVTVDGIGVALGLVAAVCQAVFVIVSRSGYAVAAPTTATLVILAVSGLGTVLLAILVGEGASLVAPLVEPGSLPHALVAGVLGAAVPSVLFITAIQRIGGTRTGILMLWEPVVGVVLAAILLGEALGPLQVVGGSLVLGAALLLQLTSEPATEPVAAPVDIV